MEALLRRVESIQLVPEENYINVIRPGSHVNWCVEGCGLSYWSDHGVRGLKKPSSGGLLVVGNSFTEALQINDQETYPDILANKLKQRGLSIPVVNAGHGALAIADYIAFAKRHQDLFQPKWTVVQLLERDLTEVTWSSSGHNHFTMKSGILGLETGHVWTHAEVDAYYAQGGLRGFYNRHPIRLLGIGKERFRQMIAESQTAVRSEEANAIPAGPNKTNDFPIEEELAMLFKAYDRKVTILWIPSVEFKSRAIVKSPIRERVFLYCRANRLSCVEPEQGFSELVSRWQSPFGFPNSKFNDGHMNAAGNAAVAGELALEITRLHSNAIF